MWRLKQISLVTSHLGQRHLVESDPIKILQRRGSGCGSVGRAVASDTRGPRIKSSHQQKFIYIEHLFTVYCVLKRLK